MANPVIVFDPCGAARRHTKAIEARIEQLSADLQWLKAHRGAPDVDAVIPLVEQELSDQKDQLTSWQDFGSKFNCP
jgi:hypothetical protein